MHDLDTRGCPLDETTAKPLVAGHASLSGAVGVAGGDGVRGHITADDPGLAHDRIDRHAYKALTAEAAHTVRGALALALSAGACVEVAISICCAGFVVAAGEGAGLVGTGLVGATILGREAANTIADGPVTGWGRRHTIVRRRASEATDVVTTDLAASTIPIRFA